MEKVSHDFDLERKYLNIPDIPGLENLNIIRWCSDAHFAIIGILVHPDLKSNEPDIEPDGRYVGVIGFFQDEFSVHRALRKLEELFPNPVIGKLFEPRRTEICSVIGGEEWEPFYVKEWGYKLEEKRREKQKTNEYKRVTR